MFSDPKIEERAAQPYLGIRSQVTMAQLPQAIPQGLDELTQWMQERGIQAVDAPLIRYHVIDMAALLDIELAFPVAAGVAGQGRIQAGLLPAGRYATLIYTGIENGYEGNKALIEWAAGQGLRLDSWPEGRGEAFAARYERLLDGPDDDPDPATWDNEVAIKLA